MLFLIRSQRPAIRTLVLQWDELLVMVISGGPLGIAAAAARYRTRSGSLLINKVADKLVAAMRCVAGIMNEELLFWNCALSHD